VTIADVIISEISNYGEGPVSGLFYTRNETQWRRKESL